MNTHIYKLKFGKKEKTLEVEAVAPQEDIAPLAEETAVVEETSDIQLSHVCK